MATPFSIPAQKVSWTEEAGGLQSTGSRRAGHGAEHAHRHTGSGSDAGHLNSGVVVITR